jgi:hypothetical protein
MKLYNDQHNAQVFNLRVFIHLLPPFMFRAFFKPIFRGKCTTSAVTQVSWVRCQRPRPDTILSRSRNCAPAFEDGLKDSPKHVRQK